MRRRPSHTPVTTHCSDTTAVVVPTLGAPSLDACLEAVGALDPAPGRVIVVLSGGAPPRMAASTVELIHVRRRLGFARAANLGLRTAMRNHKSVALVNDDAMPSPAWLGRLEHALHADPSLAAVQGTVNDRDLESVDGRGIRFDSWGLPVQVDRGHAAGGEPATRRPVLAVSATAALYRSEALRAAALADDRVFDAHFGSYHEDLDLGLRLRRLGWQAAWVPGAPCRHIGSSTGTRMRWRHPWWVLANRWRTLAANFRLGALAAAMPRLARGELRAVRTLCRSNPRAAVVAVAVAFALPYLVLRSWRRVSPGPRMHSIRELLP